MRCDRVWMLKSKNKFLEMKLIFIKSDNVKLISCFPTFKVIQYSCLWTWNKCPKTICLFLKTRLFWIKKNRQTVLKEGQRINYIQRIYYFACALNKNNSSAKRSSDCFSTSCNKIHVYTSCLEKCVFTGWCKW